MIKNFSVGPSALYPGIAEDINQIVESGILEKSHRSADFTNFSGDTIEAVRDYLEVPEDYHVFYTASASEAMEIAVRSVVTCESAHMVHGAFSKKWYEMVSGMGYEAKKIEREWGDRASLDEVEISPTAEGFFVTLNETSTGVMISNDEVKVLRQKYPEKFICADATSIAGGVYYDIGQLDVFLFSVQKCFSVPSGLGIMICSPRFFEKAKQNQEKGEHIGIVHNLVDMQKKMETKYQTQETPPVMQIGLLNAVIKRIKADYGDIHATEKEVKRRAFFLWDFFEKHEELEPFPVNSEYRSDTVIVVSGEEDVIAKYRKKAEQVGIYMAGGYGKTKSHAFRVANFTASDMKSMENLVENL